MTFCIVITTEDDSRAESHNRIGLRPLTKDNNQQQTTNPPPDLNKEGLFTYYLTIIDQPVRLLIIRSPLIIRCV